MDDLKKDNISQIKPASFTNWQKKDKQNQRFFCSLVIVTFVLSLIAIPNCFLNVIAISNSDSTANLELTAQKRLNIVELADYQIEDTEVKDVFVKGSYAYIATGMGDFHIVDISDPLHPSKIGEYYEYEADFFDIEIIGDKAYIASSDKGLIIIDISNPSYPIKIGDWDNESSSASAFDVEVIGDLAYLVQDGLKIINISVSSHPEIISEYTKSGYAQGVAICGSYAYLADGNEGMVVIDISNPSNPIEVGHISDESGDFARGITVSDNHAFLAQEGLLIFDISTPDNPIKVSEAPIRVDEYGHSLEDPFGVAINGSYAFLPNNYGGLRVLDISNLYDPIDVGEYRDEEGFAWNVAVQGNNIFLADGLDGLEILSIIGTYTSSNKIPGFTVSTIIISIIGLNVFNIIFVRKVKKERNK